jgi:hypothetical protein
MTTVQNLPYFGSGNGQGSRRRKSETFFSRHIAVFATNAVENLENGTVASAEIECHDALSDERDAAA